MLDLQTLGRLDLWRDGERKSTLLRQPKRIALLVVLATHHPDGPVRRDQLLALLWPRSTGRQARNALSSTLSRLRASLGSHVVAGSGEALWLEEAEFRSDVASFQEAVRLGDDQDALALYRGEFLKGCHLAPIRPFEDWVDVHRQKFRRQAYEAALRLSADVTGKNDLLVARQALRRALRIAPARETAVRELMRTLLHMGDSAEAYCVFEEFRDRLRVGYGMEPSDDLTKLAEQIRNGGRVPQEPLSEEAEEGAEDGTVPGALAARSRAVAVLPFRNLSDDAGDGYFAEGLAEQILHGLTSVRGLRVAARSSSFRYRGDVDVRTVGDELMVGVVLQGSVQRAGARLRVNVQLVDATTGYQLWSELYDRETADALAIQDEIMRSIVETLRVELLNGARAGLSERARGTTSADALDLYLRGRHYWHNRQEVGLEVALDFFGRAVEEDPEYALAYCGLGQIYVTLGTYGFLPPADARSRALEATENAIAFAPALPDARSIRGVALGVMEWKWGEGSRYLAEAADSAPGRAEIHVWRALVRSLGGLDPDGAFESAILASSLAPRSPWVRATSGLSLLALGWLEEARSQFAAALHIEPMMATAVAGIGLVAAAAGDFDEALPALERASRLTSGAVAVEGMLGCVAARAGDEERSSGVLEDLTRRAEEEYVDPTATAMVRGQLGDADQALSDIERAVELRSPALPSIYRYGLLDPLRGFERFETAIERLVGEASGSTSPVEDAPRANGRGYSSSRAEGSGRRGLTS